MDEIDPLAPDQGAASGVESRDPPASGAATAVDRVVRAEAAFRAVRLARKLIVLVVGLTVVLFGVIMIVTPGPAIVVIPAGLAILATEFIWARRILKWLKSQIPHWKKNGADKRGSSAPQAP